LQPTGETRKPTFLMLLTHEMNLDGLKNKLAATNGVSYICAGYVKLGKWRLELETHRNDFVQFNVAPDRRLQ
jgi:hypothetical protein